MTPKVIKAVAGEDYTISAYFEDGERRLIDCKPLIEAGGVFKPLKDKKLFVSALTVMNKTVAWDLTGDRNPRKCIDLDRTVIYESDKAI